jgi:hypothetical protein
MHYPFQAQQEHKESSNPFQQTRQWEAMCYGQLKRAQYIAQSGQLLRL